MNLRSLLNPKVLLFSNLSVKQTVAKNIFWLGFAEFINRLLRFVLIVYVARILGALEYGKFTFALSFASLFGMMSDFGLTTIATRDIAKNLSSSQQNTDENKKNQDFCGALFGLRAILSILTLFLLFIFSFFVTDNFEIQKIIFVVSFVVIFDRLSDLVISIFRAHQKMEYEALGKIIQALLTVIFGFLILFYLPSALSLSFAYFAAGFLSLFLIILIYHKKVQSFKFGWDFEFWKNLIKLSWPIGVSIIFSAVYGNVDSIIMGKLNQIKEVGYYSAAYRIITVIAIPYFLIYQSFFPTVSFFWEKGRANLTSIFSKYNEVILTFIVPIIVGSVVLGDKIINFVYGAQYLSSILAFQILIFSAFFIYLNSSWNLILIISNNQRKYFYINFIGALVNVVLNFILIPKYSFYGAAISIVLSQLMMALILYIWAQKIFPTKIFRFFIIPLISSLVMYLFIKIPFIFNQNIILIILSGFVIYLITFVILRFGAIYIKKAIL